MYLVPTSSFRGLHVGLHLQQISDSLQRPENDGDGVIASRRRVQLQRLRVGIRHVQTERLPKSETTVHINDIILYITIIIINRIIIIKLLIYQRLKDPSDSESKYPGSAALPGTVRASDNPFQSMYRYQTPVHNRRYSMILVLLCTSETSNKSTLSGQLLVTSNVVYHSQPARTVQNIIHLFIKSHHSRLLRIVTCDQGTVTIRCIRTTFLSSFLAKTS